VRTRTEFPDDAMRYLDTGQGGVYHEAGYDAYATGFAFLRMIHYLHRASAWPAPSPRSLPCFA
jgi:hypothetical protein